VGSGVKLLRHGTALHTEKLVLDATDQAYTSIQIVIHRLQ